MIGRGSPDQVAARPEQLDDLRLRLLGGETRQLRVGLGGATAASSDSHPGVPHVTGPSVPFCWMMARTGSFSSRHQVTSVDVTEGADHRDAAALGGIGERCARTGTRTPKSGVLTCDPNSGL